MECSDRKFTVYGNFVNLHILFNTFFMESFICRVFNSFKGTVGVILGDPLFAEWQVINSQR